MPEGDTVFRLAHYLQHELSGRQVVAGFALSTVTGANSDLSARTVESVYANGKHLYIAFDDDWLLRSHLGMWGSWHGYAPGERWQKPRRSAAVVIDVGKRLFVCFRPLQVELLRNGGLRHRDRLRTLGPDLLGAVVDAAGIISRLRQLVTGTTPIADVLLDQRIAAGIGNVYKSEVLFLHGCDPRRPIGQCDDQQVEQIYQTAHRLLVRNSRGGPRMTRWPKDGGAGLWVYGRTGLPCLKCDRSIVAYRLGRNQRSTFCCEGCQPPETEPGGNG